MPLRKKLLLLGGSAQQIVAIDTAKHLGYETILCDYLPDNPGQFHADKFYQTSTTDKTAILGIAQKEKIDGIVAYASDPAAPTAAFVAEQMGLAGNPLKSVETLCNKDQFRIFLEENGFNAPRAGSYVTREQGLNARNYFNLPVIVKPVDSSGSKGATIVRDWADLEEAIVFAFSFSRSSRIIVEEYIEKKHPYLIGGDIFIVNGKVELWGLLNCHRDNQVNHLVPVGKSYPLVLNEEDEAALHKTLQRMVDKLRIRNGAMNVELIIDRNGLVWPIDVGPRNGGNMIPELLGYIWGIDIVELTVRAAMGEHVQLCATNGIPYYATHNLHSSRSGKFINIGFSEKLEQYIVRKSIYKKAGDQVEYFDNAAKALGIIFLRFPNRETMMQMLEDINSHVFIRLEE